MASRILLLLILISAFSLVPVHARGDSGADRPSAAEAVKSAKISAPAGDTASAKEREEKDYWCKRTAYYKKRIEKAQYEVDKEDELLSELRDTDPLETGADKKYIDKKIAKTQEKLVGAQKLLRDRQGDLARLEEEAHSKNIPPDWLQCRPEW